MSVVLDTDIAIEVLRGRDQGILSDWFGLIDSGTSVLYSSVTAAEVWAGARPHEHQSISRFFRALLCIPVDYETGKLAGEFLRKYAKSHGVETADALIAASAALSSATLWTRNRKHYPMSAVTFYR